MLDALQQLMNAQTLAETGDSESVVDLGVGFAPTPDKAARLDMNVTALDAVTGNETYTAEVQESDDLQAWTATGLLLTVAAVGQISKLFSATKRYQKLVWTLGGTTPSVTASAWISLP
ncbi:MAG: hypothetical protein ABFD92_01995 [Planctomycetaceae bacterium]|nr:hypothetical protein [Planctomycetaceae bacterium]